MRPDLWYFCIGYARLHWAIRTVDCGNWAPGLTHEQVAKPAARGAVALERLVLGQRGRQRDAELDESAVTACLVCLAWLGLRGRGFGRHGASVRWKSVKVRVDDGCCCCCATGSLETDRQFAFLW